VPVKRERDETRPLGVVYTPREVAYPMVRLALDPLIAGKSAEELLALRICDPAIGEGAFLVEVLDVLAGALVERGVDRADARRQVAQHCIHGVDVDRRAVEAARAATGAPASALAVGDALALDWDDARFDAVVANPPYVRQEWLADKARLRELASYDGVADLYVYFIELANRLLRDGGRFCLIVPNKWLTVAYGEKLRAFLAEAGSVDGVADLSRAQLFADADAFPCIVWGTRRTRASAPSTVRAVRASAVTAVGDALAGGEDVPRARWGAGPWHLDGGNERALLERLERELPRLGDVVTGKPARGVVTGCNRAFVIDRAQKEALLAREPAAAPLVRPFVKGRDVRRWRHHDAGRFILLVDRGTSLEELPHVRAHLEAFRAQLEPRPADHAGAWAGRKPGNYRWYELQDPVGLLVKSRTPRLLYQDIQTQPACALDRDGDSVPDTTVWMLPTDDLALLAVLDSPLYGWYARRRFPPALNGAVRPKLAYLTAMPVPAWSKDERAVIVRLVERRLAGDEAVESAIARAVADAYRLSAAERALI
jgi:hypothetical protein